MSWELVVSIFGIVLGANGAFEFVKFLITRADEKNDTPERKALKALCEDKLYELLIKWKHADDRPASEWAIIESLYEGYKALKGNGEIKKLFQECKEIETTD